MVEADDSPDPGWQPGNRSDARLDETLYWARRRPGFNEYADAGSSQRTREFVGVVDYYLQHPDERPEIGQRLPIHLTEAEIELLPRWRLVVETILKAAWNALGLLFLLLLALFVLGRLL